MRTRTLHLMTIHLTTTLMVLASAFGFAAVPAPLTNLAHLDFLTHTITPTAQAGHSTYRMAEESSLLTLWTYAEPVEAEAYRWVGGGDYHPDTDTWGQGAYNTDDLTRAAVVYLRHWRQTGEQSSRASAYGLLRTVAYMQTLTPGPTRGNVVLWMQPDGTLNPSAEPVELPDPSDSGASYWLARTIWAFGEGYEAFITDDPAFAAFLEGRLQLALSALERQVLVNYPTTTVLHGFDTPTWLINDGADASSEAIYGLSAYVRASDNPQARRVIEQLAEGLMLLRSDTRTEFPFGATLPWTGSRSLWHGWGAQMAGALATAGEVLGEPEMIDAARHEMSTFIPLLLTHGGADQGWTPTPAEQVQIAYGADAVLQNLLQVAHVTDEVVFEQLAGIAGAWYFGNNRANRAMYDVATGRTFDGLETDGRINPNSGAESTIHGLLSMLALDAHPDVNAAAYGMTRVSQQAWQLVEAETGELSGSANLVTPESAWNGEASWSGGSYLTLEPESSVSLNVELPVDGYYLVLPVFLKQPLAKDAVGIDITLGAQGYRTLWQGGAGAPGSSVNEGLLSIALAPQPTDLHKLSGGTTPLTVTHVGQESAQLDALLIRPEIATLELQGTAYIALLQSWSQQRRVETLSYPDSQAQAFVYDADGRLTEITVGFDGSIRVPVVAGGFSYVATVGGG